MFSGYELNNLNIYNQSIQTFKSHNFRMLWSSSVAAHMSLGMQQVLLGWISYEISESIVFVGLIFALRQVPFVLGGMLAGILSDVVDRKFLIVSTSIALAIISISTGGLNHFFPFSMISLSILALVLGAIDSVQLTTRSAYAYQINEHNSALNGIALINLASRVGQIIGSLLGGLLIAKFTISFGFYFMGTGYILSAAVAYLMHRSINATDSKQSGSPIANLLSYFLLLKNNKQLQVLFASCTLTELFGFSYQVLLPVLVAETLEQGGFTLGILNATKSLGGIFSIFLIVSAQTRTGNMKMISLLILGFGIGELMLANSSTLPFMIMAVFAINLISGATDIVHQTLMQSITDTAQRGKAMGTWVVGVGIGPAGHLEVAYLAKLFSSRIALIINGGMLIGLAVLISTIQQQRRNRNL